MREGDPSGRVGEWVGSPQGRNGVYFIWPSTGGHLLAAFTCHGMEGVGVVNQIGLASMALPENAQQQGLLSSSKDTSGTGRFHCRRRRTQSTSGLFTQTPSCFWERSVARHCFSLPPDLLSISPFFSKQLVPGVKTSGKSNSSH